MNFTLNPQEAFLVRYEANRYTHPPITMIFDFLTPEFSDLALVYFSTANAGESVDPGGGCVACRLTLRAQRL